MTTEDFRPAADEPAVRSPQLRLLVDAARRQPTPVVTVEPETLHRAWAQRKKSQRNTWIMGVAAAAAVVLGVGAISTWGGASSDNVGTMSADAVAGGRTVDGPGEPGPPTASRTAEGVPSLAAAVVVQSLDRAERSAEVIGPYRVRLTDGRWSVDSDADQAVVIEVPDGHLQLERGYVEVQVAAAVSRVTVVRGEVVRFDRQAKRVEGEGVATPVPDEADEVDESSPEVAPSATLPPSGKSAEELAAEAETHLVAGRRSKAIETLGRLVTRHPRSSAAQTGLLDLARLLERGGEHDRARCAYALFVKRWPGHALAGDVAKAKAALGAGPQCRGLRPQG